MKISDDIIIARVKGQNRLTLCDGSALFTTKEKGMVVYDLITKERYNLWDDIKEYLAFGYFKSLKGFMGKDLDKRTLVALYKHIQTDEFKQEFVKTCKDFKDWTDKLGEVLDRCDNLYDL